jgi:hypothetical protein
MNRLRKRIELLEKRIIRQPIVLTLPDGSARSLPGHPSYVLDLMMRSFEQEDLPEMALIAKSINSAEPRGAHMVDVARLLHVARKRSASSARTRTQ